MDKQTNTRTDVQKDERVDGCPVGTNRNRKGRCTANTDSIV